jgi:hypothetical protein
MGVAENATDEVAQHLLRRLEVCDHAVPERPRRPDVRRRAADHLARLSAHGLHLAGSLVDRDNRGLEQHDPFTAPENDCICRPQIDGELPIR